LNNTVTVESQPELANKSSFNQLQVSIPNMTGKNANCFK